MKQWILSFSVLALIPISATASSTLEFGEDTVAAYGPISSEDAFRVADDIIGGEYEEFFRMDSFGKSAVIEVLRGFLSDTEFQELRDAYLHSVYAPESGRPNVDGNCGWWMSLGQGGRNHQIVIEALYAVDQNIWGQNSRIPFPWGSYLNEGCCLMGNWNYMGFGDGRGGQCKVFARDVLERASGGAASLPGDRYDYRPWYPYRNRSDGYRHAQAGELMQFQGSLLHTAIIISNLGGGKFEVVDSNWWSCGYGKEKIAKHILFAGNGDAGRADLKFYVIDCY